MVFIFLGWNFLLHLPFLIFALSYSYYSWSRSKRDYFSSKTEFVWLIVYPFVLLIHGAFAGLICKSCFNVHCSFSLSLSLSFSLLLLSDPLYHPSPSLSVLLDYTFDFVIIILTVGGFAISSTLLHIYKFEDLKVRMVSKHG